MCCGGSCPQYKDPVLITAQALSILGVALSYAGIVALIFGIACMIMLQAVWCCRMNRCGLNTAGVFAGIVAVVSFIWAVLILICTEETDPWHEDYGDECIPVIGGVLLLVSGGLWLTIATLVFTFANSQRFQRCYQASDPETKQQAAALQQAGAGGAAGNSKNSQIHKINAPTAVEAEPVIEADVVPVEQDIEVATSGGGTDNDNEVVVEETVESQGPDGEKKSVTTTRFKGGHSQIVETILYDDGTKRIVKTCLDQNGQQTSMEETVEDLDDD